MKTGPHLHLWVIMSRSISKIHAGMVVLAIPHAQREQSRVISVGHHIYCMFIYIFVDQLYFNDRLTFSNVRSMTSHQIYRLALPLLSPEMLSSSSKSRTLLYNVHLALLSGWMTQLPAQTHRLVSSFSKLELALEVRALLSPFADHQTTSRIMCSS